MDGRIWFDGARLRRGAARQVFDDVADERAAWAALVLELQERLVRLARDEPRAHTADQVLAMQPNPPAFTAEVRKYLAPMADAFNYHDMVAVYHSVERFLNWAGVGDAVRSVRGADVLSSGCGVGGSLVAYKAYGANTVTGVEIEPALAFLSRLRTEDIGGIEVLDTDGGPLPFPDRRFHLIESLDVLEHVRDPGAYMTELRRVLALDGVILMAVPNRAYPVEQHIGVKGVPWFPLKVANAWCRVLMRLPGLDNAQRHRYWSVQHVRTHNISWREIERLAEANDLVAERVHARDHANYWPHARDPAWVEALARRQLGAVVAPTRQLVAVLRHR